MAKNTLYLALGEESSRGTKESTTVGFIPLLSPGIPALEFDDRRRKEFRGGDAALGDSTVTRMKRSWSGSVEMPLFTEAGGEAGAVGTMLKHFFGHATTAQNGATGQYAHIFYPVAEPFGTSNLGDRALTLNLNINEGAAVKNWPFVGGRVKSLSFEQEAGSQLKVSAGLMGQYRDAVTSEVGSPVFAAENIRCDYNNLSVYTGSVTRAGTAPDFTDFTFAGATRISPEKISVSIENGMEDALRLSGVNYPDRTRLGRFKVSVEMTLDWEDPATGFSSVDDFNAWAAGASETNIMLRWDTGTQAGSGDNHGLYIDIPRAQRAGGGPDYSIDKDPMVTLKYEGLLDAATGYIAGALIKNTASAV